MGIRLNLVHSAVRRPILYADMPINVPRRGLWSAYLVWLKVHFLPTTQKQLRRGMNAEVWILTFKMLVFKTGVSKAL